MALSISLVLDGRTTYRLVQLDLIVIGTYGNPIAAAANMGPRHFTGRNGTIQGCNGNCLHPQRRYVTYSYIIVVEWLGLLVRIQIFGFLGFTQSLQTNVPLPSQSLARYSSSHSLLHSLSNRNIIK
jgi:hypothetical protein